MKLLGKNKENSIENLSNGTCAEVGTRMFTNKYLIRLLWPFFVEQLLVFAIGIADSFMVASVGEEAVSAVSLVDSIMMLLITIMTALATGGAVVVGQFLGQKRSGGQKSRRSTASVRYGAFSDHRCSHVYLSQGASAACLWRCRTAGHGILRYIL